MSFLTDWNVRLTKTAGLCYSRRERKYNVETRTARIELSTKVTSDCSDLFPAAVFCTSVLGDRLCRQAERHSYPRDVSRCIMGCFWLQVVFLLTLASGSESFQGWSWASLASVGRASHEKVSISHCRTPDPLWLHPGIAGSQSCQ